MKRSGKTGRVGAVLIAVVAIGLSACTNVFPEKAASYTIARGDTPEAAVSITFPFKSDYTKYVDTMGKYGPYKISLITLSDNVSHPAGCIYTQAIDQPKKVTVTCTVSDPNDTISADAQDVKLIAERDALTDEEEKWSAVDMTRYQMLLPEEPACLTNVENSDKDLFDFISDILDGSNKVCLAIYRSGENPNYLKDVCEPMYDHLSNVECVDVVLKGFEATFSTDTDAYSSPKLILPAKAVVAAPDCDEDPTAAGCEDFSIGPGGDPASPPEDEAEGGDGGDGGAEDDVGANTAGDAGCTLVGTAAVNPVSLLLVSCALLPLVRGRRMRGKS